MSATAPGNGLELPCLPKRSSLGERRYEKLTPAIKLLIIVDNGQAVRSSFHHYLTSGDIAVTNRQ
jgi:hypothetical protein